MIYPKFPAAGDTIGICAPSSGVGHKLESFDLSLDTFKSCGFNTTETASVRAEANPSAPAEIRGEEFNSLFRDDTVTAIYSAMGGEYNIEMLPYIDKAAITEHPKWFAGYSDPTNIMYYMTTKLDIAALYGTNAGSFDTRPLHESQQNALEILRGNIVPQHSYELWDSNRSWESIRMDTPVSWDLYLPGKTEPSHDADFSVSGRLIGGCTDVIDALFGTPYEDTLGFIDRYAEDGFIWYFDTFEVTPFNLYLFMYKIKLSGYLRNARAIIFGRVMYPGSASDEEYLRLLMRAVDDIPFIWGADIGHTKPAMTIINGAIGHLSCKGGKASLEMELK